MNAFRSLLRELSMLGPDVFSRLLALLAQATLPLAMVLLALYLLRRRGPTSRLFLANAALAALLVLAVLSLGLTGRYRARWMLALPHRPYNGPIARREDSTYVPIYTGATDTYDKVIELIPPPATRIEAVDGLAWPNHLPEQPSQQMAFMRDHFYAVPAGLPHAAASVTNQTVNGSVRLGNQRRLTLLAALRRLPLEDWYALGMIVWGIGTLLLLCRLALSWLVMNNLVRRCKPVTDERVLELMWEQSAALGVNPPQLLVSKRVRGPLLTGLFRPVVVLPAGYEADFAPEDLRAVLIHELAHLAQRDGWWTLLARLLCAVCWPHPLLWALCRQRAEAGEEACDMAVLMRGCSGIAYARCLVALAERLRPGRVSPAALGVIGSRSEVSRRVEQILRGARQAPPVLTMGVRLPVLALVPALVCGSLYCVGATGYQRPHPPQITSLVIDPPPNNDEVRLRTLETECAVARQQLAVAQASLAMFRSALQQAQAQYAQTLAGRNLARADLQSALAQREAVRAQMEAIAQQEVALRARRLNSPNSPSPEAAARRQAQEEAMKANLLSIQAELSQTQAKLASVRATRSVTQAQVAQRQAMIKQLQATVVQAQVAVVAAQRRLEAAERALAAARARHKRHRSPNLTSAPPADGTAPDSTGPVFTPALQEAGTPSGGADREPARQERAEIGTQQNEIEAAEFRRQGAELALANEQLAQTNAKSTAVELAGQTVSSAELSALEGKLADAEQRLADMKTMYSESHPRVKAAEAYVADLVARLQKLQRGSSRHVRYEAMGLMVKRLQQTRDAAMDDLADLKLRYSDMHPMVRAAQQRLDQLDAELTGLKRQWDQMYAGIQFSPDTVEAPIVITRFTVEFCDDSLQTGGGRHNGARSETGGARRNSSPSQEGDRLSWSIFVRDDTARSMETQLTRITTYYDRNGDPLKSDILKCPSVLYTCHGKTQRMHTSAGRARLLDSAPAGTTTVKYRYELQARMQGENGSHASDTQSTAMHTIDLTRRDAVAHAN
jgi:beta-lactamase regulating signal transducer with metallopeptidase domain